MEYLDQLFLSASCAGIKFQEGGVIQGYKRALEAVEVLFEHDIDLVQEFRQQFQPSCYGSEISGPSSSTPRDTTNKVIFPKFFNFVNFFVRLIMNPLGKNPEKWGSQHFCRFSPACLCTKSSESTRNYSWKTHCFNLFDDSSQGFCKNIATF